MHFAIFGEWLCDVVKKCKHSCPTSSLVDVFKPYRLGTCPKLAGGRGVETEGGSQQGRGHERWAVKRGRVMQICVRDHVEVHPQKKFFIL